MKKQNEKKTSEMAFELQRTRERIIEIIDEKTKTENQVHSMKLAKKDLKSELA